MISASSEGARSWILETTAVVVSYMSEQFCDGCQRLFPRECCYVLTALAGRMRKPFAWTVHNGDALLSKHSDRLFERPSASEGLVDERQDGGRGVSPDCFGCNVERVGVVDAQGKLVDGVVGGGRDNKSVRRCGVRPGLPSGSVVAAYIVATETVDCRDVEERDCRRGSDDIYLPAIAVREMD